MVNSYSRQPVFSGIFLRLSFSKCSHHNDAYWSLCFHSYIGSLTGIKPGIFAISINERNSLKGGYIGLIEWLYNINRNQSFISFAIRDMLMNSNSFDETVHYLSNVPLLAPCYYIISGPQKGQVEINVIYLLVLRIIIIQSHF